MVSYNGSCAGDLERLITPPYDVISPEQQDTYYEAHDFNIIRLVLGKQYPSDGDADNRYTRAAATLRKWLDDGVLVRGRRPCLTVYQMEFDIPDGGRRTIDGIVTLVKVEDYGKGRVLPHEKTYQGPKQDQLDLTRACRANLTPIHSLFNDKGNQVLRQYSPLIQGPPDQEVRDGDGTIHRTWTFEDQGAISRIKDLIENRSLFIADGHHRYETALAYREEIGRSGGADSDNGSEYVMMYLTSTSHPGLTILPAHRLVKGVEAAVVRGLFEKVEAYFDIEEMNFTCDDSHECARKLIAGISSYSEVTGSFGVAVHGESGFRLLKLKSFEGVDPIIDAGIPGPLRDLDVTILRDVIMCYGLGVDRERPEGHIEYTPSVAVALEKVWHGDIQACFILNPTRVEQVQAAAELGHKLPQKSTYFYPKLASGLVLNVF